MPASTLLRKKQPNSWVLVKPFLERDRWAGARIPFVKIGARAVRYRADDLNAYINAQIRQSTSDSGE
jgi:hypothetical protein